jgi:hypothetical protein
MSAMDVSILLFAGLGVVIIWLIIVTALLASQKQFLRQLGKGVVKKDLTSLLKQIFESLNQASEKLQQLEATTKLLEDEAAAHFQKIGFIRFNPFSETGGDQSFSLCLLDEMNNGIVITSLHSREATRLYAKTITANTLDKSEFSKEEWSAYQEAVSGKKSIQPQVIVNK